MQYPEIGQPDCVSIVVCDSVIEDKRTNKKSLIGLFSGILAEQLPVRRSFYIVASITNMVKPSPLKIKIVDPSRAAVFVLDLTAKPDAPEFSETHVHDIVVDIQGFEFKQQGVYTVELWAGDEPLLGNRHVAVMLKE